MKRLLSLSITFLSFVAASSQASQAALHGRQQGFHHSGCIGLVLDGELTVTEVTFVSPDGEIGRIYFDTSEVEALPLLVALDAWFR